MNTAHVASPAFPTYLSHARKCSRYLQRTLDTDTGLQEWLQNSFDTSCSSEEMYRLLNDSGFNLQDEIELGRALRHLRKQVMLKLILRDLNGLCGLDEVMQAMTTLAEVCIRQAQDCLMRAMAAQFGQPLGEHSKTPQSLLVIGMGKLGGGELNVSSDIDLIFVYAEDGETDGPRVLGNHEFFTRLGRRMINLINELTADGYVFRVDMRLRPYGDSGPLVMSFAALEEYLVSQGREWERYAWIKARVISPAEHPQIAELEKLARPFVFRRYLDFGAIDSMRKLHAQIREEVRRRDRLNNIKLGPGGIREIEFIAQVFQLIRGGRDAELRIRPTQAVLRALSAKGQLSLEIARMLDDAYILLRNLEHRLQYLDDQQTQALPDKPEDQELVAQAMGFTDYPALLSVLSGHREKVGEQFEQIFGAPETGSADENLWQDGLDTDNLSADLVKLGYRQSGETAERLQQLRLGSRYRQLPDNSRQRLDLLVPQLIKLAATTADPDATLSRLLGLLEGISRRSSYLAFLAEYPESLNLLTRMVAASSWAAEYLMQHPMLLDELLDAREIYQAPDWGQIESKLQRALEDCGDDAERQLDLLRHAQQEQTFHLLAMDLQEQLPLEKLSDHLSELADLMLRHVLELGWRSVRKKHCEQPRFAIVAYGKLGGKELGYASDLDLIFLYEDDHPDAQENYARLAQRINTLLSSYTASGRLYETDLRLRPNGASGLLVSSVAAFEDYQQHNAWVWEHQALTRARFCAGDATVGAKFEDIRHRILCQPRDVADLRREILAMRQKMHDGHPNPTALFDIKHDRGGMVDIEFMVQFLVLAHAQQHPALTGNIGNLALLNLAAELALIPSGAAEQTRNLYRTLRKIQHRLRLNNDGPCRIAPEEVDTHACRELWHLLLE
ncbi:MAG: bifunctional [glutamate--ammonia ligase]-adenylyl-L-tyrosine phosphorylase/[glutamate--ammonia-ligase] adenylyltransferase [Gallionella sp.]|jgi:glutamate-ammonia-ligase adenylyltransferase|nr:bifunctional [glutamate--ammonia ligase]-adenylyl-L-tyrosine phosphorylase/[glutamate--ammonia-ligase] adenylyltransferase [Gallionella sp.]